MTEPESTTQTRGKGGKGKAVFKRGKSESPSETASQGRQEPGTSPSTDPGHDEMSRDENPQIIARIQQQAYWLYEAGGFKDGHALEHWLEAERQVTGASRRSTGKPSTERP